MPAAMAPAQPKPLTRRCWRSEGCLNSRRLRESGGPERRARRRILDSRLRENDDFLSVLAAQLHALRRDRMRAASLAFFGRQLLVQRGIMERRVLAFDRLVDRLFEAVRPHPFLGRPHITVAANLIEPPIDLQPVTVGIAELDRDLRPGPAAAFEVDLHLVLLQMLARDEDLIERRDFE